LGMPDKNPSTPTSSKKHKLPLDFNTASNPQKTGRRKNVGRP
jgi:hypothetical protein